MKTAIIIISDPQNGDEALGRLFNGLALAAEAQGKGDEINVVYSGSGVRWPAQLSKLFHPSNCLYNAVRDSITGLSCGYAASFEANKSIQSCGLKEIKDHPLQGTPGLASIRR
jgi:hypothetical protein